VKKPSQSFVFLLCAALIAYGAPRFDDVKPKLELKGSLQIRANIYHGDESETVEPIADTKFYLLDENIVSILKRADFNPVDENDKPLTDETNYLAATVNAFNSDDENSVFVSVLISSAINKRTVAKLETNDFGIGKLKTVRAGKFYLFGIYREESEIFVWHLPVEIKLGTNKIELDQHNAATVISES
jgi:hypothetical protein